VIEYRRRIPGVWRRAGAPEGAGWPDVDKIMPMFPYFCVLVLYEIFSAISELRTGVRMDFFERLFGISVDGGNGSLELLFFLIPLVGILLLRIWRKRTRRT
jgi:hypothetical protein